MSKSVTESAVTLRRDICRELTRSLHESDAVRAAFDLSRQDIAAYNHALLLGAADFMAGLVDDCATPTVESRLDVSHYVASAVVRGVARATTVGEA